MSEFDTLPSASVTAILATEIRAALAAAGSLNSAELRTHCPSARDTTAISRVLYKLKQSGDIAYSESDSGTRRYRLAARPADPPETRDDTPAHGLPAAAPNDQPRRTHPGDPIIRAILAMPAPREPRLQEGQMHVDRIAALVAQLDQGHAIPPDPDITAWLADLRDTLHALSA